MEINPDTGVLGFKTGDYVEVQEATIGGESATWSYLGTLPPGVTMSTSGLYTGIVTVPGFWKGTIVATAGNEVKTQPRTWGTYDAGYEFGLGIETNIDLTSGEISFPTSPDGKLHGKEGDHLPLLIALTKGGKQFDLPVVGISFGLKEYEDEPRLILSDSISFTKMGAGSKTRWLHIVHLDPQVLAVPLSDYEMEKTPDGDATATTPDTEIITRVNLACDIRFDIMQEDETLQPPTIIRTSQIFLLDLERRIT